MVSKTNDILSRCLVLRKKTIEYIGGTMEEKHILRLISLKESITDVTPSLEITSLTVNVEEGSEYESEVMVTLPQHQAFFCYVYSVKGIIIPKQSWYEGVGSFRIPICITSEHMMAGGIYDDRLYMVFPGTCRELNVCISCVKEQTTERDFPSNMRLTVTEFKDPIEAVFSKRTYTMTEQIAMHLVNKTKESVRITLNHDEGVITPSYIEMFITNEWNQEWFVKKNTISRIFGRLSFQQSPFETVHLIMKVFQEEELLYQQELAINITRYDTYKTPYYIENEEDYETMRRTAFEIMRNGRMRRNASIVKEGIQYAYACLNFCQKDYPLRRTMILMLSLVGMIKERDEELNKMMKYIEYYEACYGVCDLVGLYKDTDMNGSFQKIVACQESRIRRVRYDGYKKLYDAGERSWILFAEAIGLLNQAPHIPTNEDSFYGVCLHMALNRQCVSKEWLSKIERHYYVLQKQSWMSSHIGFGLHECIGGDNMMKMLCYLCIREKRYDTQANYVYKVGIKRRLFIRDLEHYYYYSVWEGKEEVDVSLLSPATKIQILPDDIQCYIFTAIVEEGEQTAHLMRHWSRHIEEKLIKWMERKRDPAELAPFIVFCYEYWWESHRERYRKFLNYIHVERAVNRVMNLPKAYKQAIIASLIECGHGSHPAMPITYYKSVSDIPLETLWFDMATAPFVPEIKKEYPLYRKTLIDESSIESQRVFFREMARWVVVEDVQLPDIIMDDMLTFYQSAVVWDTGILYALIHYEQSRQKENQKVLQNLIKDAQNHDIMVPYNGDYVYYMTHPTHEMTIVYRYPDMKAFRQKPMQRSEFGIFYAKVTLFYDEVMEYYLVETDRQGERQIVYSDRFAKTEFYESEQDSDGKEEVMERLDQLAVAMDVDDIKGLRILIQEQKSFEAEVRQLNRI